MIEISEPRLRANGKHNFEIIVTDQGIGLNDEDRQNLFNPFFRSSDPQNVAMNVSSNGIGLNFSKKLATLLGGNLTLSDTYRKGCQFTLSLDLDVVDLDLEFEEMARTTRRREEKKRKVKAKLQKKRESRSLLEPIEECDMEQSFSERGSFPKQNRPNDDSGGSEIGAVPNGLLKSQQKIGIDLAPK
jgi:hypothetical protein